MFNRVQSNETVERYVWEDSPITPNESAFNGNYKAVLLGFGLAVGLAVGLAMVLVGLVVSGGLSLF